MAELEKENLNERNEAQNSQTEDYIEAISEIQKNSVPKDKYDALVEERRKLLQAVVNGQRIEAQNEEPDLESREVYYKKYKENKFKNDLDYWENFLNLRKATIKELGSDPCVTGSYGFTPDGTKLDAAYGEAETIAEQMDIMQELVDESEGNPFLFKSLLASAMPRK